MTLVEMLERNAREVCGKPALIYWDRVMDYASLNEAANRLSHRLIEMGLKKGDRIGMMLPRVPELVITFLASAKAASIAVPINFELPDFMISAALGKITPKFIVAGAAFAGHALKSLPEGSDTRIIIVGEGDGPFIKWDGLLASGSPENPLLEASFEDVVYLNCTSGSTGNSKGALTTHANIYWNTVASVEALALKSEDVHLCMFAPFAHPHEIFARPLFLGGTMVLVDIVSPKAIAAAITRHRVTCMMGLAPMYDNLLELLDYREYDLSSLRIPESGGMYTRPDLINRFSSRLGVSIVPVWGSTETTGIALANTPGGLTPSGSVGKPCPSYEVRLVDESGADVAPGEVGELIFKGPAVVSGYFEADANSSFMGGWYYSGDLATKDTDGYYYFVERKSGMMKVAGLKVYPAEIEKVLLEHPDIKEASVIAARDELRGEVPKAFIALKNGKALASRDIARFCKDRLAHYKIPRIIEFMDALPKTTSGKINKKALQVLQTENV